MQHTLKFTLIVGLLLFAAPQVRGEIQIDIDPLTLGNSLDDHLVLDCVADVGMAAGVTFYSDNAVSGPDGFPERWHVVFTLDDEVANPTPFNSLELIVSCPDGTDEQSSIITFPPFAVWYLPGPANPPSEDSVFEGIDLECADPVNLPPVVSQVLTSLSIDEDGSDSSIDLNQVFTDPDDDVLAFSYAGNTHITVDIVDGFVTLTPDADWSGEETLVFTAADAEFAVDEDLLVTVVPMNDEPQILLPDSFTFEENTVLHEDFTPYISDIDEELLLLTADPNDNVFVEIVDFDVTFSAILDFAGSETLTFYIEDELTRVVVSDTVEIIVTAAPNQSPEVVMPLQPLSFLEDGMDDSIDLNAVFTDPDDDPLTFSVAGEVNLTVMIAGGLVTITPDPDWHGDETLSFTASDGDLSAVEELLVTIESVDDVPVLVVPFSDVSIFEGEYEQWCITAEEILPHFFDPDHELTASDTCVDLDLDYNGVLPIEVCVMGGEVQLCESFDLIVHSVNDAPVIDLHLSSGTTCGDVQDLGHFEGATEGFIPEWQAGLITLDLADVDNANLVVNYLIDGEVVFSELLALGTGIPLTYYEGIEDYYDQNVSFHIVVSDGLADAWNQDGSECTWNLGFLDLAEAQVPGEFYLKQNYPNPFNPATTIEFGLAVAQHVHVGVYNLSGQKVADLLDADLVGGHHILQWNAENQSSGVYFLVIESTMHREIMKMTYLR
jgi:hypothetical protein